MKGKYEYKANLNIGFATAERNDTFTVGDMGYEKSEWDALTNKERETELNNYVDTWSQNFIEISWT